MWLPEARGKAPSRRGSGRWSPRQEADARRPTEAGCTGAACLVWNGRARGRASWRPPSLSDATGLVLARTDEQQKCLAELEMSYPYTLSEPLYTKQGEPDPPSYKYQAGPDGGLVPVRQSRELQSFGTGSETAPAPRYVESSADYRGGFGFGGKDFAHRGSRLCAVCLVGTAGVIAGLVV